MHEVGNEGRGPSKKLFIFYVVIQPHLRGAGRRPDAARPCGHDRPAAPGSQGGRGHLPQGGHQAGHDHRRPRRDCFRDRAITGAELDAMTDETLDREVGNISVYARVSPENKIRLEPYKVKTPGHAPGGFGCCSITG